MVIFIPFTYSIFNGVFFGFSIYLIFFIFTEYQLFCKKTQKIVSKIKKFCSRYNYAVILPFSSNSSTGKRRSRKAQSSHSKLYNRKIGTLANDGEIEEVLTKKINVRHSISSSAENNTEIRLYDQENELGTEHSIDDEEVYQSFGSDTSCDDDSDDEDELIHLFDHNKYTNLSFELNEIVQDTSRSSATTTKHQKYIHPVLNVPKVDSSVQDTTKDFEYEFIFNSMPDQTSVESGIDFSSLSQSFLSNSYLNDRYVTRKTGVDSMQPPMIATDSSYTVV